MYIRNINKPYKIALVIPFFLSVDFLVKKVTVTGIMGKTQGVSNAINPPSKPRKKMVIRLLFFVPSSPQGFTGLLISMDVIFILAASTPPSNAVTKETSVDG